MKKSLIALAVLAASGVASAQSTVTIYGLLDTYVGSIKVDDGTSSVRQTVVNSGGLQTSRFGLKGSEQLGGGLKANFVLESGFNIDTGAASAYTNPYTNASSNSVFSRQSWVGLSGGFGEVKVGKMWTPYDMVKGLGAAGFDANVFAPATYTWVSNNYQDRPGNAVYYETPNIGGFSGAAMYSFGENKQVATNTGDAGRIISFNVAYAGGPISAALAYQTEKATDASTATKYTQLNAGYDLGVAKILAAYGNVKDSAVAPKTREYQLGLDFPLGAITLSGGYAWSKDTGLPQEVKRKGFGLGALYALSKRTNLYVGANSSKETQAAQADAKVTAFIAGVRHTF